MSFCIIKRIDEFGEIEKIFENIDSGFIKKVNVFAERLKLLLLSSIDGEDCNIYNIMQLQEIKNELAVLQANINIDNSGIQVLLKVVEETIAEGDYTYLKICSIDKDDEIIAPFQQFFKIK